ncbi:hypothetical protein [Streptomyces cyslabdanicus]|uniref:hypothetical protein n=1 Tax=Streptomyces cyslabdanicus TaxID=1470456 RepID=UPI004044F3E7
MKLGKALATGVAEERSPVRAEKSGLPETSQGIQEAGEFRASQEIRAPQAAVAPEEAPAAR